MEELWSLPASWAWVEFREAADIRLELVDAKQFPDAVHIAPNHIESGTGRLLGTGTVGGDRVAGPKHRFNKGQLLYSKIRPYLAKAAIAPTDGFCSSDMYPLEPRCDVAFLLNWLVSPAFTHRVSKDQGRTVLPKINLATLNSLPVPMPPPKEQRRIVAKLEALQSRSRRAREALDAVPPLLEKLRQSILAAAFRGDLTKDWRAQNPNPEPASALLARIRTERRKKWEASELTKLIAKGKPPADQAWRARYEEPAPIDATDLPGLPDGWCWARAEEVCELITKGTTPSADKLASSGEVPFLKVYNLTFDGRIDFTIEPTFIGRATHEGELLRSRLRPGDVLMNIVGPPLGKVGVVPEEHPEWNMNQAIAVFRTVPGLRHEYLARHLLSSKAVQWAVRQGKATAGQLNLTLEICRDLPVPVCPPEEQAGIVREIESAIHAANRLADGATIGIEKMGELSRSLLAKAFRGELVPQDSTDEPADVMLARLKAEAPVESSSKRARRAKAAE
jgi:type I restriction enzyme, S subunit